MQTSSTYTYSFANPISTVFSGILLLLVSAKSNKVPSRLQASGELIAYRGLFLIDKDGKILISETGAANWNCNKVRNLLDDLIKK